MSSSTQNFPIENSTQKSSKRKKILKGIKLFSIVLLCIIGVIIGGYFSGKMINGNKTVNGKKIIKGYKCECTCLTSSGQETCKCPEYICVENSMKERLKKCKIHCKIYNVFSYYSCVSECEHDFEKHWIWLN